MADKALPSPDDLRQLLRYEPETGKLFWKLRPLSMFPTDGQGKRWNKLFANKEAFAPGLSRKSYLNGRVWGKTIKTHRTVWAMMTGAWPVERIDHVNHDRQDNRWENLRLVSSVENSRNCSLSVKNKSGHTGVSWAKGKGKWMAQIGTKTGHITLGYFDQLSGAVEVRLMAEVKYGYHENHGCTHHVRINV